MTVSEEGIYVRVMFSSSTLRLISGNVHALPSQELKKESDFSDAHNFPPAAHVGDECRTLHSTEDCASARHYPPRIDTAPTEEKMPAVPGANSNLTLTSEIIEMVGILSEQEQIRMPS